MAKKRAAGGAKKRPATAAKKKSGTTAKKKPTKKKPAKKKPARSAKKHAAPTVKKRPPRPTGYPWLIPYLKVRDAAAMMDFYERAFGFTRKMSMPGPDGRIGHAEMTYRDAKIMFGPEGAYGDPTKAPITGGFISPVGLYIYCDDVDALYTRATQAGANGSMAPQDMFYGDRVCRMTDPDGHVWSFATNFADFDPSKAPQ
jgi:uncharacterized glyoxalase superfamily protein PhnB